ncbi:MAG: hypothetical protein AAF329_14970 [Cyanobacteria bacterium P01_A01_bin.17]
MDRKRTAWKKSRKFGDIYGGRASPKIPNRIFNRMHSLSPPGPNEKVPIYIVDNPSRDYFFPLSTEEISRELQHLPSHDWSDITHIWLRRFKTTEYENGEIPFAKFICGSGVRLIVLYPWPNDLRLFISKKRPKEHQLRLFKEYTTSLVETANGWFLEWTVPALKDFYTETLLFHEIGHNVDWYRRHWTAASRQSAEEFADQYAYEFTSQRRTTYRSV